MFELGANIVKIGLVCFRAWPPGQGPGEPCVSLGPEGGREGALGPGPGGPAGPAALLLPGALRTQLSAAWWQLRPLGAPSCSQLVAAALRSLFCAAQTATFKQGPGQREKTTFLSLSGSATQLLSLSLSLSLSGNVTVQYGLRWMESSSQR